MTFRDFYRERLFAPGLLAGTIIGAGVFSLPFVFYKAGLVIGTLYLGLGMLAYIILYLMYADIIVRTPGQHRFVGYAERYLGRSGRLAAIVTAVIEMVFVLVAYLVLSASFSALLAPSLPYWLTVGIFWLVSSVAIFLNLKRMAALEFIITLGIVLIMVIVFFAGITNGGLLNTVPLFDGLEGLLLPLPPILFALSGRQAIPALINYVRSVSPRVDVMKLIRQGIFWGTGLPAVAYFLFVIGVFGLSDTVTIDAVSGILGRVAGPVIGTVGVLGLLTLWSSYIILGLDVNDTIRFDLPMPHSARFLLVVVAPFALYLAGVDDFLLLVSVIGGFFLVLEALFIMRMWFKANRISHPQLTRSRHPYLVSFLVVLFIIALVGVAFSI